MATKKMVARFEEVRVESKSEFDEYGKPKSRLVVHCVETIFGDTPAEMQEVYTEIKDIDKAHLHEKVKKYPQLWQRYVDGLSGEASLNGWPVEDFPGFSKEAIKAIRGAGYHTIEKLAELLDEEVGLVPYMTVAIRDRLRRFLKGAELLKEQYEEESGKKGKRKGRKNAASANKAPEGGDETPEDGKPEEGNPEGLAA